MTASVSMPAPMLASLQAYQRSSNKQGVEHGLMSMTAPEPQGERFLATSFNNKWELNSKSTVPAYMRSRSCANIVTQRPSMTGLDDDMFNFEETSGRNSRSGSKSNCRQSSPKRSQSPQQSRQGSKSKTAPRRSSSVSALGGKPSAPLSPGQAATFSWMLSEANKATRTGSKPTTLAPATEDYSPVMKSKHHPIAKLNLPTFQSPNSSRQGSKASQLTTSTMCSASELPLGRPSSRPMTPLTPISHRDLPFPLHSPREVKKEKKYAKPVSLAYLAHKWKLDLHSVQEASEHFIKYATLPASKMDIHLDGELNEEAMMKVACEICEVDSVEDMCEEAKQIMLTVDTNNDGVVSFEEFVVFYSNRLFVSFVSVDKSQNDVRELGHKLGLDIVAMETYQELYAKFDTDGSGDIDYEEFTELLEKCMRVPSGSHLADSRVKKLWHECDIDGSGGIDLEEFVIFYTKHFATDADDSGTIDNYYSSIRRSSFTIPKPGEDFVGF